MYLRWLNQISSITSISAEVIQNAILSVVVISMYLGIRFVVQRRMIQTLKDGKHSELFSDLVAPLLRLIALGFLFSIWLSGKAGLASFFAMPEHLVNKFVSTLYIYLFYLGSKIVIKVFVSIKYEDNLQKQYPISRTSQFVAGIICFLLILKVWIASSTDLSTYFGLVSAGVAIALQDIIVSFVGWAYLLTTRSFKVGERIQVGENKGDVTDIKILSFSMMEVGNWSGADQPTGRVLQFPNSFLFKRVVANYNRGFDYLFSELKVLVTFESDWKKTEEILKAILKKEVGSTHYGAARQIRKASRNMHIQFGSLASKVIVSVEDSGILLSMRFLCHVLERRDTESKIWKLILDALAEEDTIDLAYPTQRLFNNHIEGKFGASSRSMVDNVVSTRETPQQPGSV